MKFALSWLKDWVELKGSVDDVSQALISVGVGLEALEDPSIHMKHVVVARVVKKDLHPNADRLSLCQIDAGGEPLQIVCGAQNFKVGDLVPLAMEGAVLPGDFKIKKGKIRGVESQGMLCSTEELGLGKGEDGLYLLPANLQPGMPLADALGLGDPVFTVETTANRPDHLSVRGLAREVAALTSAPAASPKWKLLESGAACDTQIKVSIEDLDACTFYACRIIKGVTVGPSPDWLKRRLESAGIRAINNIVDATNYVLLEWGQPLHAFDLGKLKGGQITVRSAKAGEKIKTLDGQDRQLDADDLLICDAQGGLALAGVMGGSDSEVSSSTVDLLIEAAVFKPARVRRTSRRLGLRSESSLRFERGVDAQQTLEALDRAVALMQELAGGQVAGGVVTAGSLPQARPAIVASVARINQWLGSSYDGPAIESLLKRRGFRVTLEQDRLSALAPSYRSDVSGEVDLAEEVAHLGGLDAIPSTALPEARASDPDSMEWKQIEVLREALCRLGLREAYTGTFIDPAQAHAWGLQVSAIALDSALSEDQSLLRPSLLPNLVASALASMRRKANGVGLFEFGRAFEGQAQGPRESARLAVVLCGQALESNWTQEGRAWDFYDLKGMAEALATSLGLGARIAAAQDLPGYLHPGQSARIHMGKANGWLGALHPGVLKALDVKNVVWVLELQGWDRDSGVESRFKAYSLLPSVERDVSFLADENLEAGSLIELARKEGPFTAEQVKVKSVFQGQPLPEGKKSVTLSLRFEHAERSLTDAEVNESLKLLCEKIKATLKVEVRD